MATKTWDPDYFAEKRNNFSNKYLSKNVFLALDLVNGTHTFVPSR